MSPVEPVERLGKIVSTRHELVRGADIMWILKRRGHKGMLADVCKMPEMVEQLELVKKEVDKAKNIRKKQVAAYKKKLEEEEKARKAAEEQKRKEEAARREREEQQRAFRKKIIEYTHDLKDLMGRCETGKWQDWEIGRKGAVKALDAVKSDVETEVKRIGSYHKTAAAMEVERDMNRPQAVIDEMVKLLADYEALWECVGRFEEFKADVEGRSWHGDLHPGTLEEEVRAMMTDIKKQAKSTKKSEAFKGLDAEVKDLFNANPVIAALHADFMRTRHWEEIVTEVAKIEAESGVEDLEPLDVPLPWTSSPGASCKFGDGKVLNEARTVGHIIEAGLHRGKIGIMCEEVTDKANKEAKQESQLETLQTTYETVEFGCNFYKDTDVPLLYLGEDEFEALEGDLLTLQGMVASRYEFWKPKSINWQKELNVLSDMVGMLNEVQRMWSYLEPLFMQSEEVRQELPAAAADFTDVDTHVKDRLRQMWKIKNAKSAANVPGLYEELEQLQGRQESCKKALVDFMDGKRRIFARFYFVSEADLLDILSNGSQPKKILKHVDKVLLATKQLKLDESKGGDRPTACGYVTGVGAEAMDYEPGVPLEGKVEIYFQDCLLAQKRTLRAHLGRAVPRFGEFIKKSKTGKGRAEWVVYSNNKDRDPFISEFKFFDAAQIVLLVAAMEYVKGVEAAFEAITADPGALKGYLQKVVGELTDLITVTQDTTLSKETRKRVMCMITLDAHARDIVDGLCRQGVHEKEHFAWMSQLKQRYVSPEEREQRGESKDHDARIDILNAKFFYDFEYLGNGARLVVTPLTDRIYVTATQALHLHMGCAPAGPAGTGKTESTKDLASALAICVYVVNCSPEMDYVSMGNIFMGLAASGSWGCFDEFNRLIPEVLSVCTVQFKAVSLGKKLWTHDDEKTHWVTVEGSTVTMNPNVGGFITMNPGYLGRSALPEGLKALFRPITVMVPDLMLICENFLMAEGFGTAKVLASKFYGLYSLLKELLSKQMHYDWGLRAIKSVLVVAGDMLRKASKASADGKAQEDHVLMRALRDFNIPKIVASDEVVFFGLLGDLFPGLNPPREFDPLLKEAVENACSHPDLKYHPHETGVLKAVQLQELLDIRWCVFTMGPAGAAKSASWKTLAYARRTYDPEKAVKTTEMAPTLMDVNPKTMDTRDLYGYINMATREWKDGLLSSVMRDLGQISDGDKPKWIILDGDLDANWIESMNSVMDDNRMLTLASNERIPLKQHMRMIFEIRDLKYATPATVSRAGILYISTDEGYQWKSVIESWLANRNEKTTPDQLALLRTHFEKYVPETLRFILKQMKHVVKCEDVSLVINLLRYLTALLHDGAMDGMTPEMLESTFVFASVWAFGCSLGFGDDGTDFKKNFSDWWKRTYKVVQFPSQGTIFDAYLFPDGEQKGEFGKWEECPTFSVIDFDSRTMSMSEVTVPTGETASVNYWAEHLINMRNQVMLCGLSGTGKTQIINGILKKLPHDQYMHMNINMNFYTSGSVLMSNLESVLQKQTSTTFGPPGGHRMVYFIDDLNLPFVDPYNTQSAIALLRQHCDYEHWYDMSKFTVKGIKNCQYLAAMNPTAGSFIINPRLQRWFTTFATPMPNPVSLTQIFQTFLEGHTQAGFVDDIHALVPNMIKGTLAVHKEVTENFRKTAANFHYEFNIRHLAGVFQGILMAKPAKFTTAEKFVFMWCHECERIYGDRLVSYEHLDKFYKIMETQAKKAFSSFNTGRFYSEEDPDPLVFCHFGDGIGEDPIYDQIVEQEKLQHTLDAALEDYNETNVQMDLVLFNDAMRHICKITRVINNPAGHALLVGVGGSGKQSLSRLASHICGFTTMMIQISSTYGVNDLKTDIQTMYRKAGINQIGVTFLFTDNQITNEKFLVYLNDLLNSGYIADLYAPDEKDTIISDVFSKAKAAGVPLDPVSQYDYFISMVRRNLHMILCCSPVGDDFRNRCLKFPALVNCTVIDWFQPWPEEALFSVGQKAVAELEFDSEQTREGIAAFLPKSFSMVQEMQKEFQDREGRLVYTTPKSYLELLKFYEKLLGATRAENDKNQFRLKNGIAKLKECEDVVHHLEADLAIMLTEATEKARVADGIATTVSSEKEVVEMESANAAIEAEKVGKIQRDVTAQAESAEKDLAAAEPAVDEAMKALDTLDVKALQQAKTMNTPPPGVDKVFVACMILLANVKSLTAGANVPVEKSGKVREKNREWAVCKKALLPDPKGFVEDLKGYIDCYTKGEVPLINFKEVRPILAIEGFTPEAIMGKNPAAAGLCNWVINIVIYYDVVSGVEPKRKALAEAKVTLSDATAKLAAVNEKVAQLQAKLAKLTAEYDAAAKEKHDAEEIVRKGKLKLDLAQRLIKALSSEKVRWNKSVADLEADRIKLTGNSLLSAAFVSYIGPFTKTYRTRLVNDYWVPFIQEQGIPMLADGTGHVDPISTLTTPSEVAKWNTLGLPSDPVSSENGALVCRSSRWPLIIDPQLQGIGWIKNMESQDPARPLTVVRLDNKDIIFKLKQALENGYPFLIENMGEKIDATLMPVVQRATSKRGTKQFLKLGDDEVELSPNFQLYMHTKLANPHYPPEIQAEATLVNFTVTPGGLEDQLLTLVVRKERPDMAAKKAALIQQANQCMVKIADLEDEILGRLAAAEGDITEDIDLIEGLENAKKTSNEVNKILDDGKKTAKQINMTSEKYRPTARRGSQLFFLMNRLSMVHTYYIYSLNSFVVVFSRAIGNVQQRDKQEEKAKDETTKQARGLRGLKRLQSFTKTIIKSMNRFPWSHNILLEAAHADQVDMTALNSFFTVKEGKKTTEHFTVGDRVDTNYGPGIIIEEKSEPDMYLVQISDDIQTSLGGQMRLYLAPTMIRKFIDYKERTDKLNSTITSVVFNYMRRGLFDRDKLLVTTMMFFKLQVANERLSHDIAECMMKNVPLPDAPPVPEPIASWMSEPVFHRVLQLAKVLPKDIPQIVNIQESFMSDAAAWTAWVEHGKPETQEMPGDFAGLDKAQRLPILRAMRPDRVYFALEEYITLTEGKDFVFQQPFDMATTYQESSASTPIFFVLFPGVDPTPWVEDLGRSFNVTLENRMFVNISMGQGQERPAEAQIEAMSKKGGWIMLQNLHLMQSWLPQLERKLEVCSTTAHQDFRCFLSAEPPGFSYMKNIPESLLQTCIKVSNEAPSDMKSNITRAWAEFSEARLGCVSECGEEQSNNFKTCLFGLCFFHAVMLGRIKYGQQGWSRKYGFNTGDLTICADVLESYIRDAYFNNGQQPMIPWADIKYVFGEIMYGGHITDFWDRQVDNNYLSLIFDGDVLQRKGLLGPGFPCPDPQGLDYKGYNDLVMEELPPESPPMYGLHDNSEIAYLNAACDNIFNTMLRLDVGSGGGGGGGGGGINDLIVDLQVRCPLKFDVITIHEKAVPLMGTKDAPGETQPYVLVAEQECARMNVLLTEIMRSLEELQKGLAGQLNMTVMMEELASALIINQVPGRNPFHKASWEKLAWASMKSLSSWFPDMILRCEALTRWSDKLVRPFSLWLPGLFNPTSYNTAIMQVTARSHGQPLDKMSVETHVSNMRSQEEAQRNPVDGAYVHGLFIEGARWEDSDEAQANKHVYDLEGTTCEGALADSRPRELLVPMPLMYIKAVQVQPTWEPTAVGYIRPEPDLFNCPVYTTTFRGPTFVFVATLKTDGDRRRWISAGVAISFQTAD
jgi:dynein heavy chain